MVGLPREMKIQIEREAYIEFSAWHTTLYFLSTLAWSTVLESRRKIGFKLRKYRQITADTLSLMTFWCQDKTNASQV